MLNRVKLIKEVGINHSELQSIVVSEVSKYHKVDDSDDLHKKVKSFLKFLKHKYHKHNRSFPKLIEKESQWVNEELCSVRYR